MEIGWLVIHRKLLDKPIWKGSTPEQKVVLMTLLVMVDFKPNEWEWEGEKYKTKPGEKITSISSIVKKAGKGISTQNVRSSLKRFEKLGFLTNRSTKTGRLISIVNWGSYQDVNSEPNKASDKGPTKAQQRPNKGPTPNEQGNKETREQTKEKPLSDSEESNDLEPVYKTKKGRAMKGKRLESFNLFWEAFGYKSGKASAADAWLEIDHLVDSLVSKIVSAAEKESSCRPGLIESGKTPIMAQGWISGKRWEDEPINNVGQAAGYIPPQNKTEEELFGN